jgi:hypothetical protein
MTEAPIDLLILGAGAAGMTAAIFATQLAREAGHALRIVVLDGARKPGAKILVSGGGRCNVTHQTVTEADFSGGSKPAIRNVLRAFGHEDTLRWMADLGVALKLEDTGKYFPCSDEARTVLDALLRRMRDLGVELRPSSRVTALNSTPNGFAVEVAEQRTLHARAVVLATGGLALPKSGSDGIGLRFAAAMGHSIVPTTPALVPLMLADPGLCALSGTTFDARLSLDGGASFVGSLLLTHFGLSGPAALNVSRHWLRSRLEGNEPTLRLGNAEFPAREDADRWLQARAREFPKRQLAAVLGGILPERVARWAAGEEEATMAQLPRDRRLALARRLSGYELPVTGDRGYSFAETTAGGVDLREVSHATMESRRVPGLYFCGELVDVDGRLGGFNFQWAWSSGYLAGRAAVRRLAGEK